MSVFVGLVLTGCSVSNRSMRTSPDLLLLNRTDFELSDQVVGNATTVRVLGVDWQRLFRWESGSVNVDLAQGSALPGIGLSGAGSTDNINLVYNVASSLPVIGTIIKGNTASYALADLMQEHPGYDVILYPQYYRTIKGFPPFYSKTEVKVTARLGKLKQ